MTGETLYERLGDYDGIQAVVDDFYDRLLDDDELGPFFADADMEKLRQTQTDFLCETAGGPETYDAEPVRESHLHVPFTPDHIRRAIELLYESLSELTSPKRTQRLSYRRFLNTNRTCWHDRKTIVSDMRQNDLGWKMHHRAVLKRWIAIGHL